MKNPFLEPKPSVIKGHKEPDADDLGGKPDNDADDSPRKRTAKMIKAKLFKMRKNASS